MANDLNQCNFIGRLGKDPETRYTGNGTAVCNFSLAVGWKSKNDEGTEWVNVVTFSKLAEICQQYLQKGSQVFICGSFRTRKWQDQSGNDRYSTEIVANQMQMLGSKNDSGSPRSHAPAPKDDLPTGAPAQDDFDDIPF